MKNDSIAVQLKQFEKEGLPLLPGEISILQKFTNFLDKQNNTLICNCHVCEYLREKYGTKQ